MFGPDKKLKMTPPEISAATDSTSPDAFLRAVGMNFVNYFLSGGQWHTQGGRMLKSTNWAFLVKVIFHSPKFSQ